MAVLDVARKHKHLTDGEDLEKQNRLLHDQIEKLSDKVVSSMKEGVQGPLNVSLSEEGKSQEQILEILR